MIYKTLHRKLKTEVQEPPTNKRQFLLTVFFVDCKTSKAHNIEIQPCLIRCILVKIIFHSSIFLYFRQIVCQLRKLDNQLSHIKTSLEKFFQVFEMDRYDLYGKCIVTNGLFPIASRFNQCHVKHVARISHSLIMILKSIMMITL